MFTYIFESLTSGIASLLGCFVNWFISSLNFSLGEYIKIFPMLGDVYNALQAIAIGLTAVIAGKELAYIWLGSIDRNSLKDTPINILLRSFISAAGIYFGGYILEFVTHLATIPYGYFSGYSSAAAVSDWGSVMLAVVGGAAELFLSTELAAADLAAALAEFLIILLLSINIFKLTVEVCERFMIVGVLVFTSPVIYPTIATSRTAQIFKRWWSMFVSSLIMMVSSVLFLKLIINGMAHMVDGVSPGSEGTGVPLIKLLIILATCKIAQRVDTYLAQLGLTTAVTGGNMVDDILGLAYAGRKLAAGGSRTGVLGANTGTAASRTSVGAGLRTAATAWRSGQSAKESFAAGAHAAQKHWKNNTGAGRVVSSAEQNRASGREYQKAQSEIRRENAERQAKGQPPLTASEVSQRLSSAAAADRANGTAPGMTAGQAAKAAAAGTASAAAVILAPDAVAEHVTGREALAEEAKTAAAELREENAAAVRLNAEQHEAGDAPLGDTQEQRAEDLRQRGEPPNAGTTERNLQEYGVTGRDGSPLEMDENEEAVPSKAAVLAGIGYGDCGTACGYSDDDTVMKHAAAAAAAAETGNAAGLDGDRPLVQGEMPYMPHYIRKAERNADSSENGGIPGARGENSAFIDGGTDGTIVNPRSNGTLGPKGTYAAVAQGADYYTQLTAEAGETGSRAGETRPSVSYDTASAACFTSVNDNSTGEFMAAVLASDILTPPGSTAEEISAKMSELNSAIDNTIAGMDAYAATQTMTSPGYELCGREGSKAAAVAEKVFGAAAPESITGTDARVTGVETANLGTRTDEFGSRLDCGRAYTVQYEGRSARTNVVFYDTVAYSAMSGADRELMRKYKNAAGQIFYFRAGEKNRTDILAGPKGKQVSARTVFRSVRSGLKGRNKRK